MGGAGVSLASGVGSRQESGNRGGNASSCGFDSFGLQHRSAASRRPAAARHRLVRLKAQAAVKNQPIVVAKLLARANRSLGMDEHAKLRMLERLAVRCAAVIDVLRRVAAPAGIDDSPVAQLEQQRVKWVRNVAVRALAGLFVRRAHPAILDDARPPADRSRCKGAATMRRRHEDNAWRLSVPRGHLPRLACGRMARRPRRNPVRSPPSTRLHCHHRARGW